MKTLSVVCLVLGSVCTGILPNPALAQSKAQACEIKIQTPKPGDSVGKDGWVRGTAKIPSGSYLWLFTHLKDLRGKWWPQNEGPLQIDEIDGSWVATVAYGEQRDIGEQFQIALVVVGPATNSLLLDWFEKAKTTKTYPHMVLPSTIDGCPPVTLTVSKAAH